MKNRLTTPRAIGRGAATMLALLALILTLSSMSATAAPAAPGKQPAAPTLTQYFQDIPTGNFFYPFTTQLYLDGVVSGYTCGTPPAGPCVPPDNLPYYVPNNNVTRGLMSIYIDNARSKPYSTAIVISTTAYSAFEAKTTSGGYAVLAECLNSGTNCYAVEGSAPAGDFAGYFYGGRGVYAESDDANYPALKAHAYATGAYGGHFVSDAYRTLYAKSTNPVWYSLYVDAAGSTVGSYLGGDVGISGNLSVSGSKGGYVVDIMKNVGSQALEPGDVVVMAGSSSDAVVGQIPVPAVKLADKANDSGVVGIVDQPMYVPDAATRAAYAAQQQADRDAAAAAAAQTPDQSKSKQKLSPMADIKNRISDAVGMPHADSSATSVAVGGYANVVTLGAYKMVKVDASFGAIHPGDLLTTSSHAGYAMRADPDKAKMGSIIGKAMGSLESGSGTVTVMVTLK